MHIEAMLRAAVLPGGMTMTDSSPNSDSGCPQLVFAAAF
jgi:hypothetical protein